MSIPALPEIAKPALPDIPKPPKTSIPAFAEIAKSANDLLTKDFYHVSAGAIEVKSNTPNNVAFKITGKSSHEKATSGAIEGKYDDKINGNGKITTEPVTGTGTQRRKLYARPPLRLIFGMGASGNRLTITQTWNTLNALETKIEAADHVTEGLKFEGIFSFLPESQKKGAKVNVHFKQPKIHFRAFTDLLKGPTANIDAVVGHEGFLAGASAGYDVQKAGITTFGAAVGYTQPTWTAAITATDKCSVFAASYYHKVNPLVEAGAKASWDSKTPGGAVGLEVATKYKLDAASFAKGKINDRGVAAVSYSVLLRPGVTLGVGASFDTQKLDQATHKVGTSLTFVS